MAKKRRKKKSWKERMRERQIRYQRALESHRSRIEKKLAEKERRGLKRNMIVLAICLFTVMLGVYVAGQIVKPPPATPPSQETPPQQFSEPPSGTIYIWPDGRVEPSTAPVAKVKNNYYMVKGNITFPIIVLKNDIVIDGAGYFLKGGGVKGTKGIDLSYRRNVTVVNLKIEGFDYGVYLDSALNVTISNNTFLNNYIDIWLKSASYNNITLNNISKKEGYGIWLSNSTSNFIVKNIVTENVNSTAMYLKFSSNNTISHNILANNRIGIFLYSSSYNVISRNNVTLNYEGIHLLNSRGNVITLNNVEQNEIGIGLDESSNNIIHHNNFVDNVISADAQESTSIWDDGEEGNYWSDYDGQDNDSDGVGDAPHIIDDKNHDKYPLVNPIIECGA